MSIDGSAIEETAGLRRWQLIILLVAIMSKLCLAADWFGFAATISFVSGDLHMSPGEAGFTQGAIAITYGLGFFFWSPLSRRFSGRSFYMIGLAATGLAMLAQTIVHDMLWLVLLRLVIGFFEAGVWIGTIKLVFGWYPSERRGTAMGIILAAYSFAIMLDFAIGIPIATHLGWRPFFGGLGVLSLAVAFIGGAFSRPGPVAPEVIGSVQGRTMPISHLFRSKWLYLGGFAIFGDTFALAATATWVVPAFVSVQQMPIEKGAIIGTAMGLSQIVFLVIGGLLSDRLSRTAIIQIGAVLGTLSTVLFTAATFWSMPFMALVAIASLGGAAVFSGGAIFSMLGEKFPPELGPAATGYAEVFGLASTFAAPAFMGTVISQTQSFPLAFLSFTGAELAILAIIAVLSARRSRSPGIDMAQSVAAAP